MTRHNFSPGAVAMIAGKLDIQYMHIDATIDDAAGDGAPARAT